MRILLSKAFALLMLGMAASGLRASFLQYLGSDAALRVFERYGLIILK
jgi:hypothetical protein